MKSKVQKPKAPRPLNRAERARALSFHVRKMSQSIDHYSNAIFQAWLQLNAVTDGGRSMKDHLAQLEMLTKEATKCK